MFLQCKEERMFDKKTEDKTVIAENTLFKTAKCHPRPQSSITKGKSRRMKLLERSGCFSKPHSDVSYCRATTLDDLYNAYQLVHDIYVNKGYILPNHTGIRLRPFEVVPDTATFVAKVGEKIIGVTSVAMDSSGLGLPSDKAFRREIDILRHAGRKLCEGTNWVVAPEFRHSNVINELMRCSYAHVRTSGTQDWIVSVSPGHSAFFYEFFGFEIIGSQRSYSEKIDDPVVLLRLAIDRLDERFASIDINDNDDEAWLKNHYIVNNPYYNKIEEWTTKAETTFADTAFLREFFVDRSHFLEQCTLKDLDIISRRWGEETFLDVMGHSILCRSLSLPSVNYISSLTRLLCSQTA